MEITMEAHQHNVPGKLAELLVKANELPQLCTDLKSILTKFSTSFEEYENRRAHELELEFEQIFDLALQNAPEINIFPLPRMRQELVDAAYEIVCVKTTIEIKLDEIISSCQSAHQHLFNFFTYYQSLHKFSQRSTKFTNILDEVIQHAGQFITLVSQIQTFVSTHLSKSPSVFTVIYEKVRSVVCEPELSLNYYENFSDSRKVDVLLNQQNYQTNFLLHLNKLQELEWSVYQNFTLVVDSHPSPVLNTQRCRPISLRVFNLSLSSGNTQSALQGHFPIKVYLVGEHTAENILKYNQVPENITSITRDQKEVTDRTNNPISGKIFLKANTEEKPTTSTKRPRAKTTEEAVINAPGYPVEYLEGEWDVSSNYYNFDRQLVVKDVFRKKADTDGGGTGQNRRQSSSSTSSSNSQSDKSATEKYALLFVMDITFKNEGQGRQLWTLSLPFCVTTNSSQYEKAWGSMAWNEVASDQGGRFDFQVTDRTPWSKAADMLNGTFDCLVGEPLKDFHLSFLRRKTDELIFGGNNVVTDQTEITKTNFLGAPSPNNQPQVISPWSWFFGSVSIVQVGTHLHDIWLAGHIAGFVSFEDASNELAIGLANNTANQGSFIMRFSDTSIGGLTFVFISKEMDRFVVTKFRPLETRQKRSKKECTEAVLKHISADLFKVVYPFRSDTPSVDKRQVFSKFHDWSNRHPDDYWLVRGYVCGT